MNWLLRLFPQFRDMERLSQTQATALEQEVRAHEDTKRNLEVKSVSLDAERARRLAAETVAAERREEIDRLITQNREQRETLDTIMQDRLKSLDSINLRLLEPRTAEPTPDLEKYRKMARTEAVHQIISETRARSHAVDMAVIEKLHPAFAKRVTMNQPVTASEEPAA